MTAPRTPSQAHSGNHGGMAPSEIHTVSVAQAQAELDTWRARCPGTALEVYGNLHKERDRAAWLAQKDHFETQLSLAQSLQRNVWRDVTTGEIVTPEPWKAEPTAYVAEQRRKAEEMKAYHARKAAGTTKPNGRPRTENPSEDALRCRERRAARKVA